jgi:hypothetical protein
MKNADMRVNFIPYDGIGSEILDDGYTYSTVGLSKREYTAIAAMQGLLSCTNESVTFEQIALQSVQMADALFRELDK